MKKFILLMLLVLAACEKEYDHTDSMVLICLDGVEYWSDTLLSDVEPDFLAPHYSPETGQVVRCKKRPKF